MKDIFAELNPQDWTGRKAWEIDRYLRLNAEPLDRRKHKSNWEAMTSGFPSGDDLVRLFWKARVPGSGAPEIPYVEMVESMANKGYNVRQVEILLPKGLELAQSGQMDELRALTAELIAALFAAPPDPTSPYWSYEHPAGWQQTEAAMGPHEIGQDRRALQDLDEKIYASWLGQVTGGAFGTALEGYHWKRIAEVYGPIEDYITEPETINDDVVYELVFLDVFEKLGRNLSSRDVGLEWVRQIPFGWSAEWVALHNMGDGFLPPDSGSYRNPYSDWIGAQMRGMVCGMLAPGWPREAARLAHLDGRVSHSSNGVYGEMYAATLTSLAFIRSNPRQLLQEAAAYLPQKSEYRAVLQECLDVVAPNEDPAAAWEILDRRFEQYNWIHAYPNLAADVLALWYGMGDFTRSFQLLAYAGLDVDCNAGLVGSILGAMNGVPEKWARPIGDRLDTYLKGKEIVSIRSLAERTAQMAQV